MSPSTNTLSGPTTSNESTTTSTLTFPYMTQTDFSTTISNIIKYLFANFYDKHAKQDAKFRETIADQDAKFNAKFEKQIQNLSLSIKYDSTKFSLNIDNQGNKISSFTTYYYERLDKNDL